MCYLSAYLSFYRSQLFFRAVQASSEFYKEAEGKYDLDFKNPDSDPTKWITSQELTDLYKGFIEKFPMASIEDGHAEDDWDGFASTKTSALLFIYFGAALEPFSRTAPHHKFRMQATSPFVRHKAGRACASDAACRGM